MFARSLICLSLILSVALAGCAGSKSSGGVSEQPLLDQIKERGKIVAGVKYDSKPFGYMDTDGKVKGYDVDLMREVAKRVLGDPQAIEFQQVLSSTRVIALNMGKLDIVAATMTITPEREEVIDFSRKYYEAAQTVMVPKTSTVKNVDDLKDKTVLFVLGTTGEKNIKKRLPNAKYLGFKSSVDAFSALKAGRGDALTTDDTILYGFMGDSCQFRLLPEKLSSEPYGLGVKQDARNQSTESFRKLVDKVLADMESDGTMAKLEKKWLDSYKTAAACK